MAFALMRDNHTFVLFAKQRKSTAWIEQADENSSFCVGDALHVHLEVVRATEQTQ